MRGTLALLDGIGFGEMLVIAFLSVLVFGGRLPEVMRNLGRTYAKFRQGLQNVARPLREEIQRATTLPPEPAPTSTPALPPAAEPRPPAASAEVGLPEPQPPEGGTPWALDAPPTPRPQAPADDLDEPPPV